MTTEMDEKAEILARMIDEALLQIHRERRGFLLITMPFDKKTARIEYISNVKRNEVVAWMREATEGLKRALDETTH